MHTTYVQELAQNKNHHKLYFLVYCILFLISVNKETFMEDQSTKGISNRLVILQYLQILVEILIMNIIIVFSTSLE